MDVIFAKAVPSPSHHYTRLLKRSKAPEAPATQDFFAVKPPSSPHLYTPRGILKGHRRTSSELPPESPNSGKSSNSALSKTVEKSHSEISAELSLSLRGKLEGIVGNLDSNQRKGLTELIEKLLRETQAAKSEAETMQREVEGLREGLKEEESKRLEAEGRCARLNSQVMVLMQEKREFEVRLSGNQPRMLHDSLSLSFDREIASENLFSLQRELQDKVSENSKLHQKLSAVAKELLALRSGTDMS